MAGKDFFNKIGSTVTEAGKGGVAKAKELRDTAKITMEIRDRENAIHKAYRELGKAYYKDHKTDAEPAYEQVTAIKALFEELAALKSNKDNVKGVKRCSNCGAEIPEGTRFCAQCGTKYEEPVCEVTEEELEAEVDAAEDAVENEAEE
ncbi:MAG: zinc-ribbon domain-containing protein [Clostridiales bacterium]|nr:zinc-ribbon domain-containing protein [Clostridiales bacterium]